MSVVMDYTKAGRTCDEVHSVQDFFSMQRRPKRDERYGMRCEVSCICARKIDTRVKAVRHYAIYDNSSIDGSIPHDSVKLGVEECSFMCLDSLTH